MNLLYYFRKPPPNLTQTFLRRAKTQYFHDVFFNMKKVHLYNLVSPDELGSYIADPLPITHLLLYRISQMSIHPDLLFPKYHS